MRDEARAGLLCPSAPPQSADARVIGIVAGTAAQPRVQPLEVPLPVTPELLALAGPVPPQEVFRVAARCEEQGCRHFSRGACSLASKLVQLLPPVGASLPYCRIRADCRWFVQEGAQACVRCPQVVTAPSHPSAAMRRAADPDAPSAPLAVPGR